MGANPAGAGIVGGAAPPPNSAYSISGVLVFDNGLPAGGITTRIYNIGFGGLEIKLGETTSDAQGNYSLTYYPNPAGVPVTSVNPQVRVVDSTGKEVTVSKTKFNAQLQETLNLVVPASIQPPAPEFQMLSTDMATHIGSVAALANAQEGAARQDLTLLNQSTNWDARLVALAATAAQQATTTTLGQNVLYALYRVGLPTDPLQLATVPSATVQAALTKANQAGIVSLSPYEIIAAGTAFQNFATQTLLATTAAGAVSSFSELLPPPSVAVGVTQFANLYFSNPSAGADLWNQAATLQIPAATLDLLKLQGKFLYLTINNATLAQKLQQDIGSLNNISQLPDKDYHLPDTWTTTLTALAGSGGDQALQNLIPAFYTGSTTADRLAAYAGDLARKVRISFPENVVAREIDRNTLAVSANSSANVSGFLRAAALLGYKLGRTPLHVFLKNSAGNLPPLDAPSTAIVEQLHRLSSLTPNFESLQAALNLGFNSARDIASYTKDEFISKYSNAFPSVTEASLVYGRAQMISAVTFNFFTMAKQLDTATPVYALSASSDDRQNAKNAVVQQFPSMATLFGNMDFCQCDDCRSVLSPAAYFVDVLEFLRQSTSNAAGYTPLDVLLGKDETVPGRRPDLGALPLTCENTNTAMPYIDLVNEILEYYIAHAGLDTNAAYDTGTATTADLTAEPQHILPQVYNTTLKQAVYPLNLPFDLWIETVRGFLNYFKSPLAQVLDTLRPVDNLELFTDGSSRAYYRAQILAETLGISPAEYDVLTVIDPSTQMSSVQNWFKLYGYADENTALNGQLDPTDPSQYLVAPLKSAKNLSERLGLSYQELTDLVTAGFLNPGLYPLIFQFERFGIDIDDAFSYTGQPGYSALAAPQQAAFETLLDGITTQYKSQNPASTFDARTWLASLLPANYATKVLVLDDPDSGCNFTGTTLLYADGSAAQPADFLKFNLFVRLWKRLGWTLDETDRALQLFFPSTLPPWTDPGFAAAFSASWKTALVYLAHLDDLNSRLSPVLGRTALLPFWTGLPVQGSSPLYAQIFLNPSVLINDWGFDAPNGQFPWSTSDPLSNHQAAVQGALGLTAAEIAAVLADAGPAVTTVAAVVNGQNVTVPSFTLSNLSICYRYSALARCLQMEVSGMIALKAMSGLDPFHALSGAPLSVLADDVLFNQILLFVTQVVAVQNSGFSVEDLQYLLRQQFDPVGKYQSDPNVLMALVQSVATGLQQIQARNAVPANLTSMSESLIDQILSGLFPPAILKSLFALLTDAQTYTATAANVVAANAIDPAPFAQEAELSFDYESATVTQSVTCKGLLLNWKKSQLELINNSPLLSGLLDQLQAQAQLTLAQRVNDLLGVWASLAEYEAVETGVANGLPAAFATTVMQKDSALTLTYDQSDGLQWLGYRGVLTDAKKNLLTAIPIAPPALATLFANLLNNVQQQALPAYTQLAGSILAMWVNVQTYVATQSTPTAIDSVAFFQALAAAQQPGGALTDPVPEIQLSYNPEAQVQTLTCAGVLTNATGTQLANLLPGSAVLVALLQDVANQAVTMFQLLATDVLGVSAADLAIYAQPFIGVDPLKQQRLVKAQLVQAFLPLLAQKLSRQLIVQTLSSNLASDPNLTEALVTNAALLSDPANIGKSLLGAFLAVAQTGISASYYSSANGTGTPQAAGIAATTDTADPTNSQPGTASAHFEGYLQAPTDGSYRFFAELGDIGAAAALHLDPPDPAALFDNPVISPTLTAAKAGDEVSQFVQLKGGVAYHFTLDFSNLGPHGASLLIQGETLPKGPLSQIVLYSQQSIVSFSRAEILLAKVLQILQVTGLDEREIVYLVANAAQFSNLKLNALPTQPSDDSPANAIALFSQFLTLADYANLRQGPAGGTDGLIDVFQAAQSSLPEPNTPWTILANLTRRDPQIVQDVATALGPDPHFSNNIGLRRIWNALQLVQIVSIPVASLVSSTVIASTTPPPGAPTPDVIAANLKNAVKAQYTADTWRPIAQAIFDSLRQQKRDALVAYLVNALELDNSNQLFEYFLVDPGMEPVVQTSRLRLAMSSVQTFVQRCLLNLENGNTGQPAKNVSPNSMDADWWEWMKRYRVWQANREIFLFPENWMEPELRPDKTDLFQALESSLLQGDITSDLVEDAFLTYLQGLDVRARLDIVAAYLDQDLSSPGFSTLYVLGRTYCHPHKYFFRNLSNGVWSAWEAVTPDIESDHIVMALWKGNLCIFWVTFITTPVAPTQQAAPVGGAVSSLTFGDLASNIFGAKAQPQVQVQLHWSEYFQGKWSNRISSDINKYSPVVVPDSFAASSVYVHVSKDVDSGGNEGAVRIHLDFPNVYEYRPSIWTNPVTTTSGVSERIVTSALTGIFGGWINVGGGHSFRVTSKNCNPDFGSAYWLPDPSMPYSATVVDATAHAGSSTLAVDFESQIASDGSGTQESEQILESVNNFELLTCANPVSPSPFLPANEPLYWQAGGLVSPFFYKDTGHPSTNNELTFFVQPSLTEKTIGQWEGWAISPPLPVQNWSNVAALDQVDLAPQVPVAGPVPVTTGDPVYSVYSMQSAVDWVTNPATSVAYGNTLIGQNGAINFAGIATSGSALGGQLIGQGFNLVGKQGLNLTQLRTLKSVQNRT
jgi:hypothetical protein